MAMILRKAYKRSHSLFTKHLQRTFYDQVTCIVDRSSTCVKPPFLKNISYSSWKLLPRCNPTWNNYGMQQFHTSPVRKLPVPPMLMLLAKPFAKILAALSGRGFRKWWRNLPQSKKDFFIQVLSRNRNKILGGVIVISGISGIYYVMHLEETPLTGRRRFVAFTPEQFNKIVEFEYNMTMELFKKGILTSDHPAYQQVLRVANQITRSNQDIKQIKDHSWRVAVIKNDEKNAFVLANGNIFIFTGMLKAVNNDDQLAFIMSHEMAHAILGHGIEQVSFAHILDVIIIIMIALIWAILPSDSIALISQWFFSKVVQIMLDLPYSRLLEKEADEVGLKMAAKACFDVREGSAFWARMHLQSEMQGEPQIEFLSTHPIHENRSQHLDTLIPEAIEIRNKLNCPNLPVTDPRKMIKIIKENYNASVGNYGVVISAVQDSTKK